MEKTNSKISAYCLKFGLKNFFVKFWQKFFSSQILSYKRLFFKFFSPNLVKASQELSNEVTSIKFEQKLVIVWSNNWKKIFQNFQKPPKMKFFQLQSEVGGEVATSQISHTTQKIRNALYFPAHVVRSLKSYKILFYLKKWVPPPQVHVLEIPSLNWEGDKQ